jgi:serine/threonine protein phosphatase PrpC
MSSSKRHFTAVIGKKEQGSYASSSPSSAARKAVSKLCAEDKNRKVEFYMRETTQSSEKKIYGPYMGYIEKLKKPIELKGRVIRYKPVAKLLKNKKMRGGVPKELKIQIPGRNNQDIVLTGDNYVIICDGHSEKDSGSVKFGRDIAKKVAEECVKLILPGIEVNEENLASLKTDFIDMVCDNFEDWRVEYPKAGTTALIVVFSPDYSSYMVVKLGDSYVLQIPQGLQQNASAYAFNSSEFSGKYVPSMSPEKLFNNYVSREISPSSIKNKFHEEYGAGLTINRMTKRFKRSGIKAGNSSPAIATLSIDPDILLPSDNIRKVFDNFTKCGIFERSPEELLIIASDGLPITDASIWSIIHSESALKQYFSKKPDHDDFTVVII